MRPLTLAQVHLENSVSIVYPGDLHGSGASVSLTESAREVHFHPITKASAYNGIVERKLGEI